MIRSRRCEDVPPRNSGSKDSVSLRSEAAASTEDVEKHDKDSSINVPSLSEDVEKTAAATIDPVAPEDNEIIDWDGPTDVENPQNWSTGKKGLNIAVVSMMTFLTPLASSMFAPGVPELMKEFRSDNSVLATFVVSVYVLGWACGPLVIAPCSELYGRLKVYHVCNVGYICFTIACALAPGLNSLIGFRFLSGCWSIAPLTIGPGSIADMVSTENRGRAMALWAMGPLMGPVVGPIAGGFLANAKGWRWIFWVIAMAVGFVSLVALITMKESYAPYLLSQKAKRLRRQIGNGNVRSKHDTGLKPRQIFTRAILRPTKLLLLSPICQLLSIYLAIAYGCLYILFTTFTFVFEENYHFSESIVGLVYLGVGIGMFIGLGYLSWASDRTLRRLTANNNGETKPEFRLPPLMYMAPTLPIGLFIYGWTAQYNVQWSVPLLGTLIFGIGQVAVYMVINTYLVDTFTLYAASAVAASTVFRALLGAVLPLVGLPMYHKLGLGWGNSLLAFVLLALCAIPYLFFIYGERIRTHPKFQIEF